MLEPATSLVDSPVDPGARAAALLRAGRVTEALDALEDAGTGRLDILGGVRATATALECRLARGDLATAMTHGDRLGPATAGVDLAAAVAHHARGELAAALDEPEPTLTHFTGVGEIVGDLPEHAEELPWRAGAALALVRTGRRREGAELARQHLGVARASGSAYALATALRTLATTDPGASPLVLLREARAVLLGVRAERLAAQVDTDLAGLLLLTSGPAAAAEGATEALALLRSAEEYAGRQELWPLQSRVRRLLDRLGAAPRRVQGEALAALTAAERRVARLAAEGRTNRQVAEELAVTVKAVEWHLSRVYRKLGISSRSRLATALGAPA